MKPTTHCSGFVSVGESKGRLPTAELPEPPKGALGAPAAGASFSSGRGVTLVAPDPAVESPVSGPSTKVGFPAIS